MKKTYKKLLRILPLTAILSMIFLNSCDELKFGNSFLDQQPDQIGINLDTIFSKKFYAMQVLTKAYTTLPYGIPTTDGSDKLSGDLLDALTDLGYSTLHYGGAQKVYYTGAYSAGNENGSSKFQFTNSSLWTGIRYAWIMIENVNRVPDMSVTEKKNAIAQAKLIIATHYVNLFRYFGGIPFFDHSVDVNESMHYQRLTVENSVTKIVKLIDDAIPDLDWQVSDNENGIITKAYAMGLKLRLLLFAASPLFNSDQPYMEGKASDEKLTWYGNYDVNRWKAAEQAGKDFMDELEKSGVYQLVQSSEQTSEGYQTAFRNAYFLRNNGEVLLSVRKNYKNNYSTNFCGGNNNYANAQCPTLAYANLFPMADGSDFPTDFNWENPAVDPFANRDPRLYQTILTNNRPYKNRKSELYVGGKDRKTADNAGTGLLLYKFSQDYTSATSVSAVDSWPEMRLSEIFLSYAEAINESNDGPTTEAYDLVDEVRNRVGLNGLSRTMNRIQFRNAVLRERACEFGYEEVRWFDIVRWKNEEAFKQDIQGINMYKDSTNPTGFHYQVFTIFPSRAWKTEWSPKWYLGAIPFNEIDKKYGLVQNPGW